MGKPRSLILDIVLLSILLKQCDSTTKEQNKAQGAKGEISLSLTLFAAQLLPIDRRKRRTWARSRTGRGGGGETRYPTGRREPGACFAICRMLVALVSPVSDMSDKSSQLSGFAQFSLIYEWPLLGAALSYLDRRNRSYFDLSDVTADSVLPTQLHGSIVPKECRGTASYLAVWKSCKADDL